MSEDNKNKFINIEPDIHKELKEFCDEHGMTMAGIAGKAIKKYMLELKRLFDITDNSKW